MRVAAPLLASIDIAADPGSSTNHALLQSGGPSSDDSRGSGDGRSGPTGGTAKRSTRGALIGVLLVVAAGVGIGASWSMTRPQRVEVFTVRASTIERALSVVGRARPAALLDIRSPNPGQVITLLHDDGDRVALGEPLAVIKATVEQAQTDALVARERAARAERHRTELVFDRTRILASRGYATRAALDEARAGLQSAQASLDAAIATRVASEELAGQFTVRAPMAGVVLFRPIDNGQVVAATTTLFQLGSDHGTEIQAQVDEGYADTLRAGQLARLVPTGSNLPFRARVTEVSPQVDSSTGGRLIKLVPLDGPVLAPGRSIDITIVIDRRAGGIAIPRGAVLDPSLALSQCHRRTRSSAG
jgi:RND family efflux transporter MFP subunit